MSKKQNLPFQEEHPSQEDLQAYYDRALDPIFFEAVEEHLKSCSYCQSEYAQLQHLAARLESLPEITLNQDLSPAILAKIQKGPEVPQELTWTLLAEGIAAGVVLGLMIPAIRTAVWIPRLIDIHSFFTGDK